MAILKSRLFDAPEGAGSKRPRFASFLTEGDTKMLGGLYADAEARGTDMKEIDKIAESLGALRKAQAAMKKQNEQDPLKGRAY